MADDPDDGYAMRKKSMDEGYSVPEPGDKEHMQRLLAWLHAEGMSAGGDGDALWYSRYIALRDLYPIVRDFFAAAPGPKWNVSEWREGMTHISVSCAPETNIHITSDEAEFKNAPSWQQVLIRW